MFYYCWKLGLTKESDLESNRTWQSETLFVNVYIMAVVIIYFNQVVCDERESSSVWRMFMFMCVCLL